MPTALVTGATAGLGAQFARQLAQRGHDLVLVARDEGRLAEQARSLRTRYHVAVEVLPADLSTSTGTDRVAARIAAEAEPIHTLVNNAGLGTYRKFGTAPLEAELGMLDLNVRAVLALSHAAVEPMVARGAGLILNVSSVAGYAPRPNNATYAASKAWVTLFSEALALQLEGTGVHVCAICPGFTRTEFHQRAGADMSAVPAWMWLAADDVVRAGLRDAERGRSISVPSARYKLLVGLARYLPRPVLRAAMRRGY